MQKFQDSLYEFLIFGLKEAQSCIFAGSFFILLFASKYLPLFGLARYDFLFIAAVLLQIILVATKVETKDELKVICIFHIIGFALESFKTQPAIASWSYPEDAFFKIGAVPLYSGFMYSAVASYICQAWRIFNLKIVNYPQYYISVPLSLAIYLNFFTHHYFLPDLRYILIFITFCVFFKTKIYFTVTKHQRMMPAVLSFVLIGFFIWIAENISTFLGAWQYPNQAYGWDMVSTSKISSWGLLVIISFMIVADLKMFKSRSKES